MWSPCGTKFPTSRTKPTAVFTEHGQTKREEVKPTVEFGKRGKARKSGNLVLAPAIIRDQTHLFMHIRIWLSEVPRQDDSKFASRCKVCVTNKKFPGWYRHLPFDIKFLLRKYDDNKVFAMTIATFRLQYEDDYEYEFSVLSTRFRFGGRNLSKCACSELKTRTCSRPRTPIWRSLLKFIQGQ